MITRARLGAQRLRRALAHVAVARNDRDLAGEHHVRRAVDRIDERVAAAVKVVELRLRDRVVDVDRREQQAALLVHLIEAMHAGRRLLRNALNSRGHVLEALRILLDRLLELGEQDRLFGAARLLVEDRGILRRLEAQVHEQRRVAAVVEDHVRAFAVAPVERAIDVVPVLLERLALVCEHRRAAHRDCRGRVILGREHVAARPAHLRTEGLERLDQHGGLDRHVQRARDPRSLERLLRPELRARGHQARHFVLGELDFLAPEFGEADVLDEVVLVRGARALRLLDGSHVYLLCPISVFGRTRPCSVS